MTHNSVPLRSVAGEPVATAALAGSAPGGTTTSLACYVQKGSDVTWRWGLNADNSWYVLKGTWVRTPFTGLTKFVTNTGVAELTTAADKTMQYYNLSGYTLRAMFAADGLGGYNYPVVAGGVELYPKY